MRRTKSRSRFPIWLLSAKHVLIIFFSAVNLFPFIWMLSTSFKPNNEILSYPPHLFPTAISFENYAMVLGTSGYSQYYLNSIIVSIFAVALTTLISLFTGYAAARYDFKGKDFLMYMILAGMAIGRFTNAMPLYFFSISTNLYDTYIILIFAYTATCLPMVSWLMQSYFKTIPRAIEDAAKIDGCSTWSAFWKIVVPIVKSPIVAGIVITLAYTWNEFILALTLTKSNEMRTVPVSMYFYQSDLGILWGPLSAAAILSILPILIVFLFLQKYFLQGFIAGTLGGT